MFRIGRIVIAALVLGAVGWAAFLWLGSIVDDRARNALLVRGTEILHQNKSDSAIVPLEDLFGNDIEGVCIVWNGPVDETPMRQASPAKFGAAITAIAKLQAGDDIQDSDTRNWVVHAVKGGMVLKTYNMAVRTPVDLYRTDVRADEALRAPEGRCFDRKVRAQLNFYSETNGEDKTLIIKVPAEPSAAKP